MIFKKLEQIFDQIWARKYAFFVVFMVIVTLSYGFLFAIDFIPEAPDKTEKTSGTDGELVPVVTDDTGIDSVSDPEIKTTDNESHPAVVETSNALPLRIIIDKLEKDIKVLNPTDDSVPALDEALLSGVDRHPDSAAF